MRWFGRRESSNFEDRRGFGGGRGLALGGGGGLVVLVLAFIFGVDPSRIINSGSENRAPQAPAATSTAEKELTSFTRVILADTEDVWTEQFQKLGKTYRQPKLVVYDGYVQSACGNAKSAVGPFYCPQDERVYIDLSFKRDMEKKLRASGDFAWAYVLAHEIGHHVQKLLGYGRDRDSSNAASVALELQADYLAGVWAHHGQRKFNFLEDGDIDEALNAAFQVGDDNLQRRSQGYVVPETFNHGTSAQRSESFRSGFQSGEIRQLAE